MCDPVSAAVGMTVAGGAIGAAGQLASGAQEEKAAYANARQLQLRAFEVREKAKYEVNALKRDFERKQGTNLAKIAGSGLNAATFSDVLADDALESYLERKAVNISADSEVRNLNNQADSQIQSGKNARTASYLGAASTAVNTGASAITMQSKFANTGNSSGGVSLK